MRLFFVAFLVFLLSPFFAFAESISVFDVDITLNVDGTFDVVETITYDFGEESRHGIFRFIEKKHPQEASSAWKDRYLAIDFHGVTKDGVTVPFTLSENGKQIEVKIGDPNRTISGVQVYQLTYTVTGGYSYFEDGSAEIYWNATGHEWNVPLEEVSVTLRGLEGVVSKAGACYVGAYQSTATCEREVRNESEIVFTASGLDAYEGVTIAQELDGSEIQIVVLEKFKWWLIFTLILPTLLILGIYLGYRYNTAHKTGRPIIAQYEPYENFKPMYAGTLFDGRLDPRDITAGLVYLAQQGYIKIRKIDRKVFFLIDVDDYEITLLRPVVAIENVFLRDVALLLFEHLNVPGTIVSLDDLQQKQVKQRDNAKRLLQLRKDLRVDMNKNGFYQTNEFLGKVMAANALLFFILLIFVEILPLAWLAFIFGGFLLMALVSVFMYERRTRKGYEALDHLKGFKLFLSVTDAERFKFHNAPQKSPEQFMEYLPYAIAFGVEKEWADVFKDITIPDPTWYDGGNIGSFSAVGLSSSLGAFSTAMAASSVSSASSSGGSGGGGFSGGGGGGGGGGSW